MNGHRHRIEYGPSALDDFDRLPTRQRAQILRKIGQLENGLRGNLKRLHQAEAIIGCAWAIIESCLASGWCYRHP
jgi:hypothetical protein